MKTQNNKSSDKQKIWAYYDGPQLPELLSSVKKTMDILVTSSSDIRISSYAQSVYSACERFINAWWRTIDNLQVSKLVEYLDACNIRSKELSSLKDSLLSTDDVVNIYIYPIGVEDGIPASELRYYTKSEIIGYDLNDEELHGVIFTNTVKPKIFSGLFREGLRLYQTYINTGDYGNTSDYLSLFNVLISVSKVFNHFNLPKKEKRNKALTVYEMLKSTRHSRFELDVEEAWKQVQVDIKAGELPYVQEIHEALLKTADYRDSPFTDDDLYISMKASAATSIYADAPSILKASWETDPFAGCEFDLATGYESTYNVIAPDNYWNPVIKTMMIDNPGKVDPRAIHLGCNSIQDRCSYIHNRLAAVLRLLPNDCTFNQQKGVDFCRVITSEKYRRDNGYPQAFNADFSNATDTLDQSFQLEVLSLVFNEAVVGFWKEVSQLEKTFIIDGNEKLTYKQSLGQPQGLLGSFDAFALAHHCIFLIIMKMGNLEDYYASDCYYLLGDDSVVSAIVPRLDLLPIHVKVTSNYTLISNLKKFLIVERGSTKAARLEFAKQSILGGNYDTPIPFRILFKSGLKDSGFYYLVSVVVWLQNHNRDMRSAFSDLLDERYGVDTKERVLVEQIVKGGFTPLFKQFEDINLRDEVDVYLMIAYGINKIKSSFIEVCLSDKVKEALNLRGLKTNDALVSMLPSKDLYITVDDKKVKRELTDERYLYLPENPNNKFLKVIKQNLGLERALEQITQIKDVNWALSAAALHLDDKEYQTLIDFANVINNMQYGIYTDSDAKDRLRVILKGLEKLSRFEMRSVSKRTAKAANLFDNIIEDYESIRRYLHN